MLKARFFLQQSIVSTRDNNGKPTAYVLGFVPADADGPVAPNSTVSIPVREAADFSTDKVYELTIAPVGK